MRGLARVGQCDVHGPVWRGSDAGICAEGGEMGKWVEESGHGERIKNDFEKEKPPCEERPFIKLCNFAATLQPFVRKFFPDDFARTLSPQTTEDQPNYCPF